MGVFQQPVRKHLTSLHLRRYPLQMSMIYMIRHGQASFGKDDYDRLSPLGKRQARILAQHLLTTGFHPHAVYSGTMVRQAATAQEVLSAYRAADRKVPELEMLGGFNEYDTAAIVTALFPDMVKEEPSLNDELPKMYVSKASFKRVFEGAMLRWVTGEFDTPEIESWKDLKARVAGSLRLITERHGRGRTIAVFTSGGAIAASLAHVLGISGERAMRLNWQLVNSSVSRFMYNEERITLAGFNTITHLELVGDPTLITYR
jgi:broad specificity phosphatase PhoE